MDLISILRRLWRRRLLVAVGLSLASIGGVLVSFEVTAGVPPRFENRQYEVGIASAGMLVDSPNSQIIDLGGGQTRADIGSLSSRARLLGNLMATSPLKDRIAARAGVATGTLIALSPSDIAGAAPATDAAARDAPDARVLEVQINEMLPIITANAQASTAAGAARISAAAVTELTLYLKQAAAVERVPYARQIIVKPLGTAQSTKVVRGAPGVLGILVAFVLALAWCAGVLGASSVARRWRQAAEIELLEPRESTGSADTTRRDAAAGETDTPVPRSIGRSGGMVA